MEALLGLHDLAAPRVELTLVSPALDFTYWPLTVEEPFGVELAERRDLAQATAELGARFVREALTDVDPDAHSVQVSGGAELVYDSLVVCIGAVRSAAFSSAVTFPSTDGTFRVDELLRGADGEGRRVAFVIPPGASWALPMYELALMTERRARAQGLRVDCVVVTPESAPLILFGSTASEAVSRILTARGIEIELDAYVHETASGSLVVSPVDHELRADAVVSLPALEGPRVRGLPCDEHGFIPIDDHARVERVKDVYAAGDGTNFPVKQGGLGTQQADVAVEGIAQRAGVDIVPTPFHPTLRGTLLTGGDSMHMRHEISGGAGEGSTSADVLWWPPHKVASRYLSAWLAGSSPRSEPEPPTAPLDVEVAWPTEWHREPMALDPLGPSGRDPDSSGG